LAVRIFLEGIMEWWNIGEMGMLACWDYWNIGIMEWLLVIGVLVIVH